MQLMLSLHAVQTEESRNVEKPIEDLHHSWVNLVLFLACWIHPIFGVALRSMLISQKKPTKPPQVKMMLIVVVVVDEAIMTMSKYSPCSGICFHAKPKTNTGHMHVDGFDGVCGHWGCLSHKLVGSVGSGRCWFVYGKFTLQPFDTLVTRMFVVTKRKWWWWRW